MNSPRTSPPTRPLAATTRGEWYRQPVVWLGALLFSASLSGCVMMIVLGTRYADEALPTSGGPSFKVPLARPPAPADPPGPAQ